MEYEFESSHPFISSDLMKEATVHMQESTHTDKKTKTQKKNGLT